MSTRKALFCLILLALTVAAFSIVRADERFEIFGSFVRRYLVMDAPEGRELLARVAGPRAMAGRMSSEEMLRVAEARLKMPEFAGERELIEERLSAIEQRYESTPEGRARAQDDETAFSRDSKLWLNEQASLGLRVDPNWSLKAGSRGHVAFLEPAPFGGLRDEFEHAHPDPSSVELKRPVLPAERARSEAELREFMEDFRSGKLKECIDSLAKDDRARMNFKFAMSNLLVDEAATLVGDVTAAGSIDNVDSRSLPADLFFEGMASLEDSWVVGRPTPVDVKWFRLQLLGTGQAGTDAVFYFLTTSKDSRGGTRDWRTAKRTIYNSAWNTAHAPVSILLYELVQGMRCMGYGKGYIIGTQVAAGLGLNYLYFKVRNATIGSQD
jgi:hypothetical protein